MNLFAKNYKIYFFIALVLFSAIIGYIIGSFTKQTYTATLKANIPLGSETISPQSALVSARSYNSYFKSKQFTNLTSKILSRNNASLQINVETLPFGKKLLFEINTTSAILEKAKSAAAEISKLIGSVYKKSYEDDLRLLNTNIKNLRNQLDDINLKLERGSTDGSLEIARQSVSKEIAEFITKINNIGMMEISTIKIDRNIPDTTKYVLISVVSSSIISIILIILLHYSSKFKN